ncbi:MAG: amino acid adenylation domain-containing protein, partial [Acidobacteriota bacterium]|nr:amino acid adenylation domain-containing protein [Acidobacteriota bacterium]
IPLILHLRGRVDGDLLESSLNAVINRHAALRTRIITENGRGLQLVSGHESLKLKVVELADDAKRSSLDQVVARALEGVRQPFVLERDLPIHAALFQMRGDESVLAVTIHHIIADKKSLHLIAGELAEVYDAKLAGRAAQLPELALQHADYTEWQRGLPKDAIEPLLFYWKWQLRGKLPALELPEDRPRPAVHTYTDARDTFKLSEHLTRRLKALGEEEGSNTFAVVLAAFKALLRRYARQDEIVVGTSEPGRVQPGTEKVVGSFANLVVLRSRLAGNPSFRTFLAELTKTVEHARAHAEMPFDLLVQELNPEKDMSRTALFDVLFQYEEREPPPLELGQATARVIDTNLGYGKYDINLSIQGEAGGLSGTVVYNADIYDRTTIERMMRHFEVMLEAMAADMGQRVDDVRLLSEDEELQQLVAWNSTQASYPEEKTIHQLFEEQARRSPGNTAVVFGDTRLTYREVDERANQLAHHLRDQGVKADTLVAMCLNKSAEMIVALLGVLKAGGAYLPMDPAYPEDRLRFMIEDSGVSHLITTQALLDSVPVKVNSVILLDADGEGIGRQETSTPSPIAGAVNLAYCIYTSGSTGKPKGVLLEHRHVVRLLVNDKLPFSFTADDVWTMFHSYCFDFSVWEMYGALLYGGKLVVVAEPVMKDPSLFLSLLLEEGVTVLNQTPTAFDNVVVQALERQAGLALRYVIFGGEALHPVQLREWKKAYPAVKLINMYGITETTVHVTFKEITDAEIEKNVSNIGSPIPTTTTYIMDADLRLLPVGVIGEVCVGGGGVSRGYLGRDELTRQKFVLNPYKAEERLYRSGDLAKLLSSGEMIYLGRIDDQVQIRGFRVELGEVQSQLLKHPAVAKAEVVARKLQTDALEIVAYVVPAAEVSVTALRNHLAQALPSYMAPSAFVMLKALPMTPNGKVDRRALPEPDGARPEVETTFVAPRTAVEESLAKIWTEVLGVERVGINDNFFELGGHSLLATQAISRVRQALHVELPLRSFFEGPTIARLSESIEKARGNGIERQSPAIRPVSRQARLVRISSEGVLAVPEVSNKEV